MSEPIEREYTNLTCSSPETAEAVKAYHDEQIAQCEESPNISAIVKDDALHITFEGVTRTVRHGWDMGLLGYRDGYDAACAALPSDAGWRSMESAPKDATPILLGLIVDGKVWRVSDAKFYGVGFYTLHGGVSCHWATHWLPLPAPPAGKE